MNDYRYFVQAGALRRTPTALAGDNFVIAIRILRRARQYGLNDALPADRFGERIDFRIVEFGAWLQSAGAQAGDRQHAGGVCPDFGIYAVCTATIAEQCGQARAQAARAFWRLAGPIRAHDRLTPSRFSISLARWA